MECGIMSMLMKLWDLISDPDNSINSIVLFVALLCVCIVIGHLLEYIPWINDYITTLLIGLGTGVILLLATGGKSSRVLQFNEELFFTYLLPPIIFNAGFQVQKKEFFRNFTKIVSFGAVGTMISFCIIAFGAKLLFEALDLGYLELGDYLAIGAVFSATDSVSTLQVLNQERMPLLHSLVFGEGVVNDATSVVLFKAIQKLDLSDIDASIATKFLGNFCSLFLTSSFLGVFNGLLSAYMTKKFYFGKHSSGREVAIMILMPYLAYLTAELFELSGILAVFFCGIVMQHYTSHNVTKDSQVTTKHAFSTFSLIAEILIFFYVGMDAIDFEKWKFVSNSPGKAVGASAALFGLVVVGRAAFIFPLSFLFNSLDRSTGNKLSFKQQVTISWAGLMRGAVSMALSYNQFAKSGHTQQPGNAITITCTITVVLFSTVVLGTLTEPVIRYLLPPGEHSNTSEPPSSNSTTLPLLLNEVESGQGIRRFRDISRSASLRMLLTPTNTVHYYWRKFDNAYMRPMFRADPSRFEERDSNSPGEQIIN